MYNYNKSEIELEAELEKLYNEVKNSGQTRFFHEDIKKIITYQFELLQMIHRLSVRVTILETK